MRIFEKILASACLSLFVVMVIVQVISAYHRVIKTTNSDFEGIPLPREVFLYEEGFITVRLNNFNANEEIKILVNGDEVGYIFDKDVRIVVKEGDVVEVATTDEQNQAIVEVTAVSENILQGYINKNTKIERKIQKIADISMK